MREWVVALIEIAAGVPIGFACGLHWSFRTRKQFEAECRQLGYDAFKNLVSEWAVDHADIEVPPDWFPDEEASKEL